MKNHWILSFVLLFLSLNLFAQVKIYPTPKKIIIPKNAKVKKLELKKPTSSYKGMWINPCVIKHIQTVNQEEHIQHSLRIEETDNPKYFYVYHRFQVKKGWSLYFTESELEYGATPNLLNIKITYPKGSFKSKRELISGNRKALRKWNRDFIYFNDYCIYRDKVYVGNSEKFWGKPCKISYVAGQPSRGVKNPRKELSTQLLNLTFVRNNSIGVPQLPWPPPRASGQVVLEEGVFEFAENLGNVDDLLSNAVNEVGYPQKSYMQTPNGFAMVCQMEQTDENAIPLAGADRWDEKIALDNNFDFFSLFESLFYPAKGHFRILLFVVSDTPFTQSGPEPEPREIEDMLGAGLNVLPNAIRAQSFTGNHYVSALIYEFERLDSGTVNMMTPGKPAKVHLEASQILEALEE